MNYPLLSICFPVFNRLDSFKYVFFEVLRQVEEINTKEIEIVVSVNPIGDDSEEMTKFIINTSKEHSIRFSINEQNIGGEGNKNAVISMALGKYVWVIGDDDLLLDGTIVRVLSVLKRYPGITWVFLNNSRLNGFPHDKSASVISLGNNLNKESGYHPDGKLEAMKLFRKGEDLLFSTSNIYLKESNEVVLEFADSSNMANGLTYVFDSALKGGAYVFGEVCIVAGGVQTWKNDYDTLLVSQFNQAIMNTSKCGYSRNDVLALIKSRMCNTSLSTWYVVFKLIVERNKNGILAYKEMLRTIPFETIIITLLYPLLCVFIVLRHMIKKMRINKELKKYVKNPNADNRILEHIHLEKK